MLTFGTRSFTWEHGRQLASQTVNGSTWTYSYNADGMRTGRTNGTNTYEYVYNGSQLMQMTRNGVVMNFTYINGIPATISYGGNTFYYVVNGQGDITGITDAQGNIQVTYYYDAWGASSSIYNSSSDYGLTLATINPLRYRGYVFDWEVGLYYLQSRYYIPELGRFLNADSLVSYTGEMLGGNQFAYGFNNPVSMMDSSGNWPKFIEDFIENVVDFGKKTGKALAGSFSASIDVGFGLGLKGDIGVVKAEGVALLGGQEWTYSGENGFETNEHTVVSAQVGLGDSVSAGVDYEYYAPYASVMEKGLWGNEDAKVDFSVGAFANNCGIGYSTTDSNDLELSFGLSGYLVMGGGFEFSLNLTRFWEIWND